MSTTSPAKCWVPSPEPAPVAKPSEYLVTSIDANGVPVTTRHHSAESAAIEVIYRTAHGHQAASAVAVEPTGPLAMNAVTKARRVATPLRRDAAPLGVQR